MESFQHQAPNIIITNTKKTLSSMRLVGTSVPGLSCWTCRRLLRTAPAWVPCPVLPVVPYWW